MKKLLVLILLVPLLHTRAYAEGLAESVGAEWDAYAVRDALPEELRDLGGELRLSGDYDGVGALERLWNKVLSVLRDRLREESRSFFALLSVCMLCAAGAALCSEKKYAEYIQIAGCAASTWLLAGSIKSLVSEAFSTLTQLSVYANAALPAIFATSAAVGAVASASSRYAASCLALDVMLTASEKVICPLIGAGIATAICASIWDNPMLRSVYKLSSKLSVALMSVMTAAFTALITLTGLVGSSADAAAVRATKTIISAALPVVGRIMSDAASSVVAAASLIRSSAGAFGIVAVCALCLAPFVRLLVKRWLLMLAASAAEMTAGDRLAKLLNDMSSIMGILLGLIGCYSLILFFTIVSALRTVSG